MESSSNKEKYTYNNSNEEWDFHYCNNTLLLLKFRENTGPTHSTEKSQQHTIYSIGIGHTGKCVF